MAYSQGHVTYGGVDVGLQRFQLTRTAGITPNVATITIALDLFQSKRWPIGGDLKFTYGSNTFRMRKCRLDSARLIYGADGTQLVELRILDRRWMWRQTGKISGFYNIRRGAEDKILGVTEKKPKELAELCLKAMDEKGYDIGGLGIRDTSRPLTEWDFTNPAEALASLAERLAFRPVVTLNDKVKLVQVGVGAALPKNSLFGDAEIDPPDMPGKITIVGDRVYYQVDFDLFPVALDLNGQILPVDEVSYAPAKGWSTYENDHFFYIVDEEGKIRKRARELAQEWVYRAYKIMLPVTLPTGEVIDSVERILPLHNEQIEFDVVEGIKRNRQPYIYGAFNKKMEDWKPAVEEPDLKVVDRPESLYRRGFSIDSELGIVRFSEMVMLSEALPDKTGYTNAAAKLKLRIAVSVREKDTRGWRRAEYEFKTPGDKHGAIGAKTKYVRRDEIRLKHWQQFTEPAGVKNNEVECKKAAQFYFDAEVAKYDLQNSGTAKYAGLLPIELDGAIQQVSYEIGEDGHCYTSVSRNREDLDYTMSYAEQRAIEKQGAALKELDRPERAKADDVRLREVIA
jgi:hypothetical protein